MERIDTLLSASWVIPVEPAGQVLADHAIAVHRGRILAVLPGGEARARYRDALVEFLSERKDQLDEDSLRRLETNPLRVLDSKDPQTQAVLVGAPALHDYLDHASREPLATLLDLLDGDGVNSCMYQRVVRGVDYL